MKIFSTYIRQFVLTCVLLIFCNGYSNAQSLLTEDFNFSGNATANGWTAHSGTGNQPVATTTGLTYAGHTGSGVGNAVTVIGSSSSAEDINRTFTNQNTDGTNIYYSCLINVTDAANKSGDYFMHLSTSTLVGRIWMRTTASGVNFGIHNSTISTYGPTNFSRNTVYLLVAKYTIFIGGAEAVSLWVIPSGMPTSEAAAGSPEYTSTSTNGLDAINAIALRQGGVNQPISVIDAIRVGTTWSSVVTASAAAPTVTTNAATAIGTSAAQLNGTVNANGSSTTVTFDYGLTTSYTLSATAAQSPLTGTSATAVSASIGSLDPNTEYNYRAKGVNTNGTTNGLNVSFITLALTPVAPTVNGATSSSLNVAINSDGNPAYTQYAIQEETSGQYVQANGTLGASAVWQSAATWSVVTVNGLASNTVYTFKVKARNTALVETSFGATAQGQTLVNTSPSIILTGTLNAFVTSAGNPTFSQNYTVSGSFLTDNIAITAPTDFQITLDTNASWGTTLNLSQSGGTVASTVIYVRYFPAVTGSVSSSITHVSTGSNNPSMPVSGSAIASQPTVQSSVTLSSVTNNSMNVSLSGGDGSSRLVIASTSPVTYVPSDGGSPSGINSVFSSATDLGGNNRAVFSGTGNSFTLSGLTQNTTYYLASYEYNGSGVTINYLTVSPGTASSTTYSNPPTFVLTPVARMKLDTLYLTFPAGNGMGRMIVMSEAASVTLAPTFGQTFTGINSNFSLATDQGGNNRIVFNGPNGTSNLTVTGLSRNTQYGIKVIEYNGNGNTSSYFITPNGAISVTTPDYQPYSNGQVYTQNFNSLPTGAATYNTSGFGTGPYYFITPPINASSMRGWQYATYFGTAGNDVVVRADTGSSTTAAIYNWSNLNASTDRALGFLAGNAFTGTAGITFINNGPEALYHATITYDGELYRIGGNSGATNQLKIQYALGTDSLLAANWVDVPDLTYTTTSSASATAVNGNTNVTPISASFIIPSSWLSGQLLTIRILDNNDSGNDNGLATDNFTFTATPATAPSQQDSMITFSAVSTTSMTANWLNGDGGGRIAIINTTNSFTSPVNATNPTANSVYSGSGEQVVYNGSGSSVNITGLTVGTTYFVRVFAYNGNGPSQVYALQTATDNPASQQTTSATPPTALSIVNINNGNPVKINHPFSITVQSVDGSNNPQNVNISTTVTITLAIGSGTLSGTVTGVITPGNNSVTISGLLYDAPEMGVELLASATSGMTLTAVQTPPFEVFDVATQLDFLTPPNNAITGVTAPVITVKAYRNDFSPDINYTDNITFNMVSGPAPLSGTLTKPAVAGQVDFNDIVFTAAGNYVLNATSGSLTPTGNITIHVSAPVSMQELVVPKYFGSKQSSGSTTSNTRTPVIACISFSNLIPDSVYSLYAGLALTSEPPTNMGAGTLWNGTSFTIGGYTNMFTADASGNSGPLWIVIQPSGNSTRFGAGEAHSIRVAIATSPFGTTIPPAQFSTVNTTTALDIPTTAYDANTANDGAFVTGTADTCFKGKFALAFDSELGLSMPLSVSGIVPSFFTNTPQSDLPASVSNVYANTAAKGSFAFVIPTGANNPSGVRRIEIRGGSNVMANNVTDSDGNWAGGNTATATRRQVVALTSAEVNMNTVTSLSLTSNNVTCFGGNDGSATALATSISPSINYTWTPGGATTPSITNLTAGNYSVVAIDAYGCAKTALATITEPSQFPITVSNDGPDCIGDSVELYATGGVSYSWTGPNGFTSTDQNPVLINITAANGGIYTCVISNASGCTQTGTTTVSVFNCNCTPPALNAVITNACNSTATGSLDLSVTGGVAPYSYSWSNGATTEDISGLIPGTYLVTVTDGISCIAQQSFVVGNYAIPVITHLTSTTFCSGGSVVLSSTAGDSYLWSNGETTQDITVSVSGNFTVSVTRGSCVLSSAPVTVTVNSFAFSGVFYSENMGTPSSNTVVGSYTGWQNGAPIVYASTSTSTTDVRTSNASTGYTGSSGTGNVFFTNTNERNFVISGINSQGYSNITLKFGLKRDGGTDPMNVEYSTDGTNWFLAHSILPSGTSWALITASTQLPAAANLRVRFTKPAGTSSYRVDDISLTGSVTTPTITMTGNAEVCGAGSAILTSNLSSGILWSTGATTKSITVTASGSYNYTATDGNGCSASPSPVTFTVHPEPIGSITSGTIACNGGTTDVVVSASGGIGPYTGTGTFNVGAGVYQYIVTDVTGCDDTVSITVNQPALLVASSTAGTIACNGGTTTVNVTATGGTTPYSGTGSFPVSAGAYSFIVTDAAGCTSETSGNVTEPAPVSITSFTPSSGIVGTSVTINGVSLTGVTAVRFNGISATFTSVSNTEISTTVPSGAQTGPITVETSCGNVTSTTNFIVNASTVTLNLKLYLQGYYIGGGMMNAVLLNQGVDTSTTVTDTITVELRDPLSPANIVYSTKAVLHTDGTATMTYPPSASGNSFYIVINHKNHVQTWSKLPVTFGTITSYDFSANISPRSSGQNPKGSLSHPGKNLIAKPAVEHKFKPIGTPAF